MGFGPFLYSGRSAARVAIWPIRWPNFSMLVIFHNLSLSNNDLAEKAKVGRILAVNRKTTMKGMKQPFFDI